MNAHFERNGIYPLSTVPVEGYGSDPVERTGKVVITHTNGKFVQVNEDGTSVLVEKAHEATQFNDHAEASIAAGKVLDKARADAEAKQAA